MYQGYRILGFPREEYSQPKHESGIKYVTTDSVTTYPVKSQHYFTSVSNFRNVNTRVIHVCKTKQNKTKYKNLLSLNAERNRFVPA